MRSPGVRVAVVVTVLVGGAPDASARAPGYPQYCCTGAGRFGPFSNGSIGRGERCSATGQDGRRYVGQACDGPPDPGILGPMENKGYANGCCTDAGIFGPFADARWQEGESCSAVVSGKRVRGTACHPVSAAGGAAFRIESVFALAPCEAPPLEPKE
jgi:hypothetical protein